MYAAVAAAVVGIAGSMASSSMQAGASKDAANTQAASNMYAANIQRQMYDETVAREQPWVTAGQNALNTLSGDLPQLTAQYGLQKYYNSPEYAVQMAAAKQQANALQAQGAATGAYGSGRMASALTSNAQNQAMQGYSTGLQDYMTQNSQTYNMLNSQSQMGQNAAANLGATGTNVANSLSNLYTQAGTAQAQGILGAANATSSGLGSISGMATGALSNYGQAQAYQKYLDTLSGGGNTSTGGIPQWNYDLNAIPQNAFSY